MPVSSKLPDDYILISVLTEVELILEPTEPLAAPHEGQQAASRFRVAGPDTPLEFVESIGDPEAAFCTLSPLSRVTVPPKARPSAGIPMAAHSFAFIYPWNIDRLGEMKMAQNAWAFVMMLGGFAYFDAHQNLIAINAITYDAAADSSGLMIIGPCRASMKAFKAMDAQERMKQITAPSLCEAGFAKFGWVHPSECFDGELIGEGRDKDESYSFGAFLYLREDSLHGTQECIFYHLVPSTSKVYTQLKNRKGVGMELSNREGGADGSPSSPPAGKSLLSAAYQEETRRSTEAVRTKKAAGRVVKIAVKEQQRRSTRVLVVEAVVAALFVGLYVGGGILFYTNVETHDSCDEDAQSGQDDWAADGTQPLCRWTAVDALYFISASISTAGYGDLSPGSAGSRWFTAIYILFGVFIVFGIAGHLVQGIIEWLEERFHSCIRIAMRIMCSAGDDDGSTEQPAWHVESAVRFYVRELGFFIFFGIATTQLLAAWLFTIAQPGLSFGDAAWHCYITSTTVGYGDVAITQQASRVLASVQIFSSVSWLAALAGRIQFAVEKRKLQKQRAWLVLAQLDEGMVDALDRGGDGVDKLEFVVGLLTSLGVRLCGEPLSFDKDVQPLIDRFEALDADSSGLLTREDLQFMVTESRRGAKGAPGTGAGSSFKIKREKATAGLVAAINDGKKGGSSSSIGTAPKLSGFAIDAANQLGTSVAQKVGSVLAKEPEPPATIVERAVNVAERAVGIDIDGDGDVGLTGHNSSALQQPSSRPPNAAYTRSARSTEQSSRSGVAPAPPPAPTAIEAPNPVPAPLLMTATMPSASTGTPASPATPPVLGGKTTPQAMRI